ncbi:hypothetical protein [Streptomyces winkii]|uniref:hypothetical protein n=1 Tax=Streptomyces winkii TaxID=3051178 RepID=UPI0028D6E35E|nr:hypothetical protein [Streptomyces sp. DSM 40971]
MPAPHFSLIALACTVVLAVALPLTAATAGPAPARGEGEGRVGAPVLAAPSPSGRPARPGAGEGHAGRPGEPTADQGASGGPSASCGPELTAAEGLSAQTCVVSEGGRTWARTHYRNATGSPLSAALTLVRPDGSSLRAECAMPASGGPGVCETPQEKSRAGGRPYAATAEAGSSDGERLLLRSFSNSLAR